MDVLIKGFDMPNSCEECPLADDECFGAWKCSYVKQWGGEKRAEDCPLMPLPSHGDLIDRDVLVDKLQQREYCKGCNNMGGILCTNCSKRNNDDRIIDCLYNEDVIIKAME